MIKNCLMLKAIMKTNVDHPTYFGIYNENVIKINNFLGLLFYFVKILNLTIFIHKYVFLVLRLCKNVLVFIVTTILAYFLQ